ncbi:LamG domain-containing protein [Pseudozobellia sp. WGM2]|uniref:LamG domain-containing protein n=1 Tax=Pseudozobellia sp. WGM2 TaxID=2787625 RepID=UPI001ADFB703|nr:LamG domain-containing protein [Pseudozobellia sp. WGM2]
MSRTAKSRRGIVLKPYGCLTSFVLLLGLAFPSSLQSQNEQKVKFVEWSIVDLLKSKSDTVQIHGSPSFVDGPYGNAVYFDGVNDALFLDAMPIDSLKNFTVEMIFNPASGGPFEQRILHMGEVSDDRILLEIRALENDWYFDGFAASGTNKTALIDENFLHPLNEWHHVAFIVTTDSLRTYVNGQLELNEPYSFKPILSGRSSIGVRLNKRSWYKGFVYKIRITSKQLSPEDFMSMSH